MTLRSKLHIYEIIIAIIVLLSKILFIDTSNYNMIISSLFILVAIAMYKSLGMQYPNKRIKKVITQITIVLILSFIIVSFITGLFTGFVKNPLNTNLTAIIKSTYGIVFLIISEEIIRFIVARKSSYNNLYHLVIITLLFICLDIIILTNKETDFYSYNFFITLTTLIIPSIIRNIICSYLAYHVGITPGFILRCFFDIYLFIFPVYPNYGNYILSIVNVIFPVILFISTNRYINNYEKTKKIISIDRKLWYLIIPISSLTVSMIVLISGFFKYQIIAVGSGSMEPTISYGDAVIFEKVNDNFKYNKLKKGNIIVFNTNNERIVHRIVEIKNDHDGIIVRTKGDANSEIDKFDLKNKDIEGIVRLNIKYIGYPTVKLNELLK